MTGQIAEPLAIDPTESADTHIADLLALSASGEGRMRFEPSGVERSLKQLWADSEVVARWLRATVGTGVRVGAFLTNTPDCPALVMAVWRSGNTLVSLPYPGRGADPERYLQQVTTMCELADVRILMVDEAYRAFLPSLPVPIPVAGFADPLIAAEGQAADEQDDDPLTPGGDLIQFTSGSLGRPKGVLLTGQALAANVQAIIVAMEAQAGEVAVTWLPLSHDMGFVGMFLTCFCGMTPEIGGELIVLQTPESFLADPASWLRLCSRFGATITTAPNFAFDLSVRSAPFLKDLDLSALRVCITGAERVRGQTLERFTETFAPMGLRPEAICPAYGMAEAALAVTLVGPHDPWRELVIDRDALGRGEVRTEIVSEPVSYVGNGRPAQGLEVRVADDDGSALPERALGEVQIRGTSLFSDYLGAERRLTPDGWFPTRDVGFLDDGELFLVGRSDETIIVGGHNHYAGDIEEVIQHDLVRPGSLAAVPLESGFGLLAEPVGAPDEAALSHACRELATRSVRHAGLRPAMVGFVRRGALMKTPSGKVQRLLMSRAIAEGRLPVLTWVWLDPKARPKGDAIR